MSNKNQIGYLMTDKPATAAYRRTLEQLRGEGFRITNYGDGIVYFQSNTEAVAVRQSTGRIISRESR
jgi:hypothetical protein